jgi:hypothetical protein
MADGISMDTVTCEVEATLVPVNGFVLMHCNRSLEHMQHLSMQSLCAVAIFSTMAALLKNVSSIFEELVIGASVSDMLPATCSLHLPSIMVRMNYEHMLQFSNII